MSIVLSSDMRGCSLEELEEIALTPPDVDEEVGKIRQDIRDLDDSIAPITVKIAARRVTTAKHSASVQNHRRKYHVAHQRYLSSVTKGQDLTRRIRGATDRINLLDRSAVALERCRSSVIAAASDGPGKLIKMSMLKAGLHLALDGTNVEIDYSVPEIRWTTKDIFIVEPDGTPIDQNFGQFNVRLRVDGGRLTATVSGFANNDNNSGYLHPHIRRSVPCFGSFGPILLSLLTSLEMGSVMLKMTEYLCSYNLESPWHTLDNWILNTYDNSRCAVCAQYGRRGMACTHCIPCVICGTFLSETEAQLGRSLCACESCLASALKVCHFSTIYQTGISNSGYVRSETMTRCTSETEPCTDFYCNLHHPPSCQTGGINEGNE